MPESSGQLRKPCACPQCGGTDIKPIMYGRPTSQGIDAMERGECSWGGCFLIPWSPDWICEDCHHRWYDADDPAKQEYEQFLKGFFEKYGIDYITAEQPDPKLSP